MTPPPAGLPAAPTPPAMARSPRPCRLRRLLIALPSLGHGGTERHTLVLMQMAAEAGVEVRLLAEPALLPGLARLLPPPLRPRLRSALIGWHHDRPAEENIARQRQALAHALTEFRPDAALLPLPWPNAGLGLLAALAERGLPGLVIGHLAPPQPPPGIAEAMPAIGPELRADWVAVSAPVARRLERAFALPPGRVAVVPNGLALPEPVDVWERRALRQALRAEHDLPPEAPVALFAGRLDPVKRAELLPFLAQAFARRGGGALLAAGAGPLAESLARQAARVGPALRLLGHRDDVEQLMLAADVLALPSQLEGQPLVFLAAALRHCPVVATAEALEAYGEAAPQLARLAPGEDIGLFAGALIAACRGGPATRRRLLAAERAARAQDQEAMLACYRDRLRQLPSLAEPVAAWL